VAVGFEGLAQVGSAVGGVAEDGQVLGFVGGRDLGDGGFVVVRPTALR